MAADIATVCAAVQQIHQGLEIHLWRTRTLSVRSCVGIHPRQDFVVGADAVAKLW